MTNSGRHYVLGASAKADGLDSAQNPPRREERAPCCSWTKTLNGVIGSKSMKDLLKWFLHEDLELSKHVDGSCVFSRKQNDRTYKVTNTL